MKERFQLQQIGTINSGEGGFVIQVEREYRPALKELSGFGYIQVLFWCHGLDTPEYRTFVSCPKPYKRAPDTLGIFATRSPARPNPIALTACGVIAIDEEVGTIIVGFIDAEDGSPLLDIKPYHPAVDRIREARVPDWCSHWPEWYEDSAAFDWAEELVSP